MNSNLRVPTTWQRIDVKSHEVYEKISEKLENMAASIVLEYQTNTFSSPTPQKTRVYHFKNNTIKVSEYDHTRLGKFEGKVEIDIFSTSGKFHDAVKLLEEIVEGIAGWEYCF
ncbi:MAG: hypothetical protein KKA65_05690 [Nanoarchaeota archaeon]|nr:hypothetical protein [Nanoarchaeota archaeon]MBU4352442.1 hypothetical protein [Nanoarchaeota archaeon]MBU4456963.1 hypothetical protein [Nanoarchaeota archaeon]MCG2720034.1 hypothetical protein [Nanoarchaeota archaeon]